MEKLKVLELYSGIGGMHFALTESGIDFEVVAAVDINNQANHIYKHNFPETTLLQKTIESFKVHDLDKLDIDMVLMSPPCQPFVRVGLQKDLEDKRSASFIYFLKILPLFAKKPSFILLENVKGFDTSQTRAMMLDTLANLNYHVQEYLLTPLQFGIPNSRLRYYMLAKSSDLPFACQMQSGVQEEIPDCVQHLLRHKVKEANEAVSCASCASTVETDKEKSRVNVEGSSPSKLGIQMNNICDDIKDNKKDAEETTGKNESEVINDDELEETNENSDSESEQNTEQNIAAYERFRSICGTVGKYLEHKDPVYFEPFLIPEKFFRRFWVMDIVTETDHNCCCFTKRYAHHIEGAGSIVQTNVESEVDLKVYKKRGTYGDDVHEAVRSLRLRFFTPREIANLMCFPPTFSFPDGHSNIQCYRVLGNSLNVHVVSVLIQLLTMMPAAEVS